MNYSIQKVFTILAIFIGCQLVAQEKFTVMLDAGHGGTDSGATTQDLKEKDIVLKVAQYVQKINDNPNLEILLTREGDDFIDLAKRSQIGNSHNPNLFLSLHVNNAKNSELIGYEVFVSHKNKSYTQSKEYAIALLKFFEDKNVKYGEHDFKVLWENENPALIFEMGYISNPTDAKALTDDYDRKAMAQNILNYLNYISKL